MNRYRNSSNHPTHIAIVIVILKMSKLNITEMGIPDFIKSVSRKRILLLWSATQEFMHHQIPCTNTHEILDQTSVVSAHPRKQVFWVSLSQPNCKFGSIYTIFKLQIYISVLCMLLKNTDTSSNDFQTKTNAELCKKLTIKFMSLPLGVILLWYYNMGGAEELPLCDEPVIYIIWYLIAGSIESITKYKGIKIHNNSKITERIHLLGRWGRILFCFL